MKVAPRQTVERVVVDFDSPEFVLHCLHVGESRRPFSTTYGFDVIEEDAA